jgi:hypothetical protein
MASPESRSCSVIAREWWGNLFADLLNVIEGANVQDIPSEPVTCKNFSPAVGWSSLVMFVRMPFDLLDMALDELH